MKQVLTIPIHVVEDPYQEVIVVDLPDELIPGWCLSLCLLNEGLVDSVILLDETTSRFKLRIAVGENLPARGTVYVRDGSIDLSITPAELDYWLHFFLTYYRDGIAAVDHIDVDIPAAQATDSRGLYLTLTVPNAHEPVSKEEARQRLGLPLRSGNTGA